MIVKDFIQYLEDWAPTSLQESYDNAQLLTGNLNMTVSKALVCLDATEAIVQEAIEKGANLIIAHHPIIFGGLKKLTGSNYVERTIILAIRNDIAIYAIHTNLDNVATGVNAEICKRLGLHNTSILSPKSSLLYKLAYFTPAEQTDRVTNALFKAGAGEIGNYSEASFTVEGKGTFRGNAFSNPTIGESGGEREIVNETKTELLVPSYLLSKVLQKLMETHPYEEVAYDVIPLQNSNQSIGSGMIGELDETMESRAFLELLAKEFNCKAIKHTALCKKSVKRVAVCGGSGQFLLSKAKLAKADIYITADFKYHEFFDADNQIIIADIGHYESEQFTIDLIVAKLREKFPNFAFLFPDTNTNPVQYFIK